MVEIMKFELKDVPMELFLGVEEEERLEPQTILVSVKFEADTKEAEVSDDITDTVDYFQMYDFIEKFPGGTPYNLLEKLHHDLREALVKNFPQAKNLSLAIEKFPFDDGSVIISD